MISHRIDFGAVSPTTEPVTVTPTTEPVTVAPTTEPVPMTPTTESVSKVTPTTAPVSVPETNGTAPMATTESTVPAKVQQLLDMGFTLPVETLINILAAANDDVSAALNVLVGSF